MAIFKDKSEYYEWCHQEISKIYLGGIKPQNPQIINQVIREIAEKLKPLDDGNKLIEEVVED